MSENEYMTTDEEVRIAFTEGMRDVALEELGYMSSSDIAAFNETSNSLFNRWLAGVEDEAAKKERERIAGLMWEEEQLPNKLLNETKLPPDDPAVIHMNGRVTGLQRARDIAEKGTRDV